MKFTMVSGILLGISSPFAFWGMHWLTHSEDLAMFVFLVCSIGGIILFTVSLLSRIDTNNEKAE